MRARGGRHAPPVPELRAVVGTLTAVDFRVARSRRPGRVSERRSATDIETATAHTTR